MADDPYGREFLKRGQLYPLADGERVPGHLPFHSFKARWDGEPRRMPRKGEWYFSGAIIEAYRAPSDLSIEFHIAELVEGEWRWQPLAD